MALQLYQSDGTYLSTIRFANPVSHSTGLLSPRILADHDFILAEPLTDVGLLAADTTARVPLVRTTYDGKEPESIAWQEFRGAYFRIEIEGRYNSLARSPLAPEERVVWSPELRSLIAVSRDDTSARVNVVRIALSGDTTARTSLLLPQVRTSEDIVQDALRAFYDRQRLGERGVEWGVFFKAAVKSLSVPEMLPSVHRIVSGSDGSTWLELQSTGQDSVTFLVLDGELDPWKLIVLGREVRVLAASRESVWTVVRDSLEVPYLQQFRIEHQ